VKIAVLCSRVRIEEKLLLAAFEARGVSVDRLDTRQLAFDVAATNPYPYDAVLVRCISDSRAFYLTRWFETLGMRTINRHEAISLCGDKLRSAIALQEAGLPIPRTVFAFEPNRMIDAIEELGYPVVLKPIRGSWGRLLAKVNDRCAAEALLEHKKTLGGVAHGVFYAQEYVDKQGRDLRILVVGDEIAYAIWRSSEHWITNTATGGEATACALSEEMRELSLRAARAVGGEIVGVDLLETADGRLLVNEINHTPEFHSSVQMPDVNVAGQMADYVIAKIEEES